MSKFVVLFTTFFVFFAGNVGFINASLPPIVAPDARESYYFPNGNIDNDSYDAEKDMEIFFKKLGEKVHQTNLIKQNSKEASKKRGCKKNHRKHKRNTKKEK
jgi:hypothetical protein